MAARCTHSTCLPVVREQSDPAPVKVRSGCVETSVRENSVISFAEAGWPAGNGKGACA
jgi:hypothetical protein